MSKSTSNADLNANPEYAGPSAARIRILLADDHTVMRDGLAAIINQERDMKVVAETGDGVQAVELWKKERPDVTLMDLQLPGLNGVDAIHEIRTFDQNARIIVLTTFDGEDDIYRSIRAGARSYLVKDVQREELFHCIRAIHQGKKFVPPAIATKLTERVPEDDLSPRELEVLRFLAEGKPNKQIAALMSISEVTVKSHVNAIFKKLNVLSRTAIIIEANRRGLIRL